MPNNQQRRGWFPQPHACPRCGRPTIFRLCDVCFAVDVADAATGPLPPVAQALLRAEEKRLATQAQQPQSRGWLEEHFGALKRLVAKGIVGGEQDGQEEHA